MAVAEEVNLETAVKQESTTAQEIMVQESVLVQVAEMVADEVNQEGVAEMPTLMPN